MGGVEDGRWCDDVLVVPVRQLVVQLGHVLDAGHLQAHATRGRALGLCDRQLTTQHIRQVSTPDLGQTTAPSALARTS